MFACLNSTIFGLHSITLGIATTIARFMFQLSLHIFYSSTGPQQPFKDRQLCMAPRSINVDQITNYTLSAPHTAAK